MEGFIWEESKLSKKIQSILYLYDEILFGSEKESV
jgi:hypothetical protein